MKKILVLGSLNMDLVTRVKITPKIGETLLGEGLEQIPGGKGANQAVAIGKLGGEVAMLGRVGMDGFGDVLMKNLATNGVEAQLTKAVQGPPTGVALIMVNDSGDNSIVVIPGANFALKKEDLTQEMFEGCDYLLAQLETPIETIEAAFSMAKEQGLYTILNPAPARTLSKQLIGLTDLLVPNETEFETLTGIHPDSEAHIKEGAQVLFDRGVKAIIITLGEDGACHVDATGDLHYEKGHKVKAVDTTAAGDSFIGGLLYGMAQGEGIKEAMKRAVIVGALTVTKLGAQSSLPTLKEVEDYVGGFR
ncbi:ribokinase [Petrocella sp. FN5]|uniref:ribokinase n=1 Tax=Petrocella sp. FN5 TaxID=3032002 RepID=UPI0023DBA16B|nr:ribokinase [Petrocella sp. FN5]MDF1616434.1 ribokinase [Petrocella sp. FN5]